MFFFTQCKGTLKHLTLLAEDLSVLQVEGALTDGLTALGADEARGVEGLLQGIYTLLQHTIYTATVCFIQTLQQL